jgi:glycolate oxidase FAD binding subunit
MPALAATLAAIVGAEHCLAGADRGAYAVDGRVPAAVVFPGTRDEAGAVVAAAAAAGAAVVPWGAGTQIGLGAPPRDQAVVVGTRRLARLVEHEPGDLTATVEAGATLGALRAALGARGQWWPLDPPGAGRATLGGVLATNASGPRRHLYGTARDLVLGLTVIGPAGEALRAGGRVVKNVAGYDLVKLHLGALGTLGLIVEATLKLRPQPEAEAGAWATFGSLAAAQGAAAAVDGDLLPCALDLADAGGAAALAARGGLPGGPAALLVGFDGLAATVAWQAEQARARLRAAGAREVAALEGPALAAALAAAADLPGLEPAARAAVTASVLPARLAAFLEASADLLAARGLAGRAVARAGSGVATLVLAPGPGAAPAAEPTPETLAALRVAAHEAGGQLRIDAAPLAVREALGVWEAPGPAGRLFQAIKARLDPAGVMNPGRFVGGL